MTKKTAKKTVEPPPDTFEAVRHDYMSLAMRYHRREIDRNQTRRERLALEVRVAALNALRKETA